MQAGDKVRLIANPARGGILGYETDGPEHRLRVLVNFFDGDEQFVLKGSLEKVETVATGPHALVVSGRYGRVADLRGAVTYYRLSGRLANLIYSLNTTNTQFFAYQFKPVLQFLDSPCSGILIADEVGLGKTIEAGLIWTELRARVDAKRLLVICPAMLREKWKMELDQRFGVQATIVDAAELRENLQEVKTNSNKQFALIASLQGLRPPRGWNDEKEPSKAQAALLARYLDEVELDEAMLDLVIIDEAHYLRNDETQTHRLATLIRPLAQSLVMLSATPIQLRSRDLFNLLHLLDENAFPFESSFAQTLHANAPVVALRDRILGGCVTRSDFLDELNEAKSHRLFDDNAQIEFLINNPPSDEELSNPRGRSEIADLLDRINPLAKVVSRTLKRDVQEFRVQRQPVTFRVEMNDIERDFYERVTTSVREYCSRVSMSEGFMLTIPQRQMSSCLAAACKGWIDRATADDDVVEESLYDIYGEQNESTKKPQMGVLLRTLVNIANNIGDTKALSRSDTKLGILIKNLKSYWNENPRKKVVLFSFYRNTLHYLASCLADEGIESVTVHGGIDKQAELRRFASDQGPDILLSSEVAAEGVDLQFASLLVNYDLPWNPSRIEQRIGRIDRIGQEADRILIWNFIYDDTVDERVYERLLERLDIFRQALGNMEAILGDEIRKLGYELLSHKLSPKEETARIDRARVAIETLNRQQVRLEEEAMQLIAHGDFIQNKVRAARELGRYVRGEDLLAYVRDYLETEFPGTRLIATDSNLVEQQLELSADARVAFADFLQAHRLQGATRLLNASSPKLIFENRVGKQSAGKERVSQDHPIVRFIAERLRLSGRRPSYCPVTAIELLGNAIGEVSLGTYVYSIARWSVSGSREIERLEYLVRNIDSGVVLDGEIAESMVNSAALHGKDWLSAQNVVNHSHAASLLDDCRNDLEERFAAYRDAQVRENQDRINLMVNSLKHHLVSQSKKIVERIDRYRQFGNDKQRRMIPAEEGRLNKLQLRIGQRIEELGMRATIKAHDSLVSCGVIRVH